MQSKRRSFIMSVVMALVGYAASVFGQMFIFWVLGMPFLFWQCLIIGGFFFLVSMGKNFLIIRIFEKKEKQ